MKTELNAHLCNLINAVHPMFCEIVNAFGKELKGKERSEIIKVPIRPTRLNRLSNAFAFELTSGIDDFG